MPSLAHRVRRIAQTPRTFTNWPAVLRGLADPRARHESLSFTTRNGLTISCPNVPGARVPVYEVFAEDCYRIDTFLAPFLGEPIGVVDIGAHIGAFACQLAAKAPRARLRCFEPSPTTAGFLRRNVWTNNFEDRVVVHELAVGARTGAAVLADNGGGSALNSIVDPDSGGSGVTVRTTTFDAIVEELGGVAEVVKMDCEGGEYELVLGSSPDSWAGVQRIVLEYHPHPDHTWPELRAWFAEQGLVVTAEEVENPAQGTAWLERRG
ncbi:MAG TPA: FkbM family methyltransferase [Jatrophihabitans sp.]|jgi:FkbM family methyltransferase|uniref:FkbM family methyltransferase n=1 Tax=Jatrophihabitans sp. TaxID=1932789 RepID=UPI002E0AECE1|nr:FkbM family methyltransferase [Jatrophihabitans sp.]